MSTKTDDQAREQQVDGVKMKVAPEAEPYLDGPLGPMIDQLETLVLEAAKRDQVTVTAIDVEFSELMKVRGRPHIRVVVQTGEDIDPDRASEYWAAISGSVDKWLAHLGPGLEKLYDDSVYVAVEWAESNVN